MSLSLYSHHEEDLLNAVRIVLAEARKTSQEQSQTSSLQLKEDLITQVEAAKFLRITVGTLITWKKSGKVPFYKIGRTIFFSKTQLLETAKQR